MQYLENTQKLVLSRVSDIEKKLQATGSASNFVSKEHMMTLETLNFNSCLFSYYSYTADKLVLDQARGLVDEE